MRRLVHPAVLCLLLAYASAASAQTNLQLWGNVTLDWVKSDRLTYELDFEPKVLLVAPEGEPGWHNLDLTPNVEYRGSAGWIWSARPPWAARTRPMT